MRQRQRQTDRQTDRLTGRQTDRKTDRQTERSGGGVERGRGGGVRLEERKESNTSGKRLPDRLKLTDDPTPEFCHSERKACN